MTRIVFVFLFAIHVLCCATEPSFEEATIRIGDRVFLVELAVESVQHAYGLKNRAVLEAERGMLFIFEGERVRRFWMQDTIIDLSIAFMDSERYIVDIQSMKSLSQKVHVSKGPAKYALEVNKGIFKMYDIQIGDRVEFEFLEENVVSRK